MELKAAVFGCVLVVFCCVLGLDGAFVRVNGERLGRNDAGEQDILDTFSDAGYLTAGNDLKLVCYSSGARLGSNVKWFKKQLTDSEVFLAQDSFLQNPFDRKGRFELKFAPSGDTDLLSTLIIRSVSIQDSGVYRCQYSDNNEELSVTTDIAIGDNYEIAMYASRVGSIWGDEHRLENGEELALREGDEWKVRCEFRAGNPINPIINVTLGERDLTNKFDSETESRLVTREPDLGEVGSTDGLNYIEHDITYTSREPITVTYDSNRRELTCASYMTDLEPSTMYVIPKLHFAPVITCEEKTVKVDEMDPAEFRCKVKADPLVEDVYWTWNTTGHENTTLRHGESSTLYTAYREPGAVVDEAHHILTISRAYMQTFRAYDLVAVSDVSTTTQRLHLKLGKKASGASQLTTGAVLTVLAALAALLIH